MTQDDRMPDHADALAFAHIGDLHLTDARQRNFTDFLAIVAQIEIQCAAALDFVVLPGDNADNGLPGQYALAATALKMLSVPVHAIPGDHDMEQGGLASFYRVLKADPLPKALTVRGVRCLFLDISGPGSGGPDFRLGTDQSAWLERELDRAAADGVPSVVFTHTYPDELRGDGETETMNRLLAAHDVALVDMGHTHYNELANDGRTVFAATRSTGQIEEGPVGYSVATLDRGIVSWRFKALDDAFPFVVITAPADHRLMRGPAQRVEGRCTVRARVFGATPPRSVVCRVEDGEWVSMQRKPRASGRWSAVLDLPGRADRRDRGAGRRRVWAGRASTSIRAGGPALQPTDSPGAAGSDADAVGAWPENGIFGTQLGPNRNGVRLVLTAPVPLLFSKIPASEALCR